MTALNSKEGLSLLHRYGVECEYDGTIKGKCLTPLQYCATTGSIDMAKHLVSLGADPQYYLNRKILLISALKLGSTEMYYYFISIGVNPNEYAPYASTGSRLVPPILCDLVKDNKLDLLKRFLSDGDILLSMDLTAINKRNALITAIRYYNKIAAKLLLATMRFPLFQKEQTQERGNKTALDYLEEEHDWADIKSISNFLLNYTDMNKFLMEKIDLCCRMDHFIPTIDEDGKPTIHFISASKDVLKRVALHVAFSCTIKKDDDGKFYIRMGIKRLSSLLGNKDVANFLLNEAKESIFWRNRNPLVAEAFHGPAIHGHLKTIANEDLESYGIFLHPSDLPFYALLVRESLSLETAKISFGGERNTSALFLANAVMHHPCLRKLDLVFSAEDSIDGECLDRIRKLILSLPALKVVQLSIGDMSMDRLLQIIASHTLIKDRALEIVIDGFAGDIISFAGSLRVLNVHNSIRLSTDPLDHNAILAAATLKSQTQFYSRVPYEEGRQPKKFLQAIKETGYLSLNGNFSPACTNMCIQYARIHSLKQIDFAFDKNGLQALDVVALRKIFEKTEIKKVEISFSAHFSVLLGASSVTKIEELELSFCKFNSTEDILQLTEFLKQAKQLKTLSLTYVKFEVDAKEAFESLCTAIGEHPHLRSLIATSIKFASIADKDFFWQSMLKSRSLQGFSDDQYEKANPYGERLATVCKQNLDAEERTAQKITYHGLSSAFFCRERRQDRDVSMGDDMLFKNNGRTDFVNSVVDQEFFLASKL
ncbi:MAG: hypothetical protein HY939_01155 [Gammaproteobacteria bacterium]|nr:hypothetical protein [Gammaproteobacteria bacterium]